MKGASGPSGGGRTPRGRSHADEIRPEGLLFHSLWAIRVNNTRSALNMSASSAPRISEAKTGGGGEAT